MIHNVIRRVINPSRHDPGPGPIGELGVLFDQSPIAMVFRDRQLRARRTNVAFRRLAGLPDEAIIGVPANLASSVSRAAGAPRPAPSTACRRTAGLRLRSGSRPVFCGR